MRFYGTTGGGVLQKADLSPDRSADQPSVVGWHRAARAGEALAETVHAGIRQTEAVIFSFPFPFADRPKLETSHMLPQFSANGSLDPLHAP